MGGLEDKAKRMAHDYMIDHIKHLRRNAVRAEAMDSDWYKADIENAVLIERERAVKILHGYYANRYEDGSWDRDPVHNDLIDSVCADILRGN